MTNQKTPLNAFHLIAEQYKASRIQYEQSLAIIESGYESLMRAEQESQDLFLKMSKQKMEDIAKFRSDQIAELKEQYAISDEDLKSE